MTPIASVLQHSSRTRSWILVSLLLAALISLTAEVVFLLPRALDWYPWDYGIYLQMGNAVRQGLNPYGEHRYYPLPTVLWVFVPLSLLPDWFRLVWAAVPLISIPILLRRRGMLLFFFAPLWVAVAQGMLEGSLLFPLAWLVGDVPILAGLGAAIVLLKPHLAILAVAYMVCRWLGTRNWRNLLTFAGTLSLLYLPSFILNPFWPPQMLDAAGIRADQTVSLLPTFTSSAWSWWWLGVAGKAAFFVIVAAAAVLFWRAYRLYSNRPAALLSLNLLLVPLFFPASSIIIIPTLSEWSEIIVLVSIALAAFVLDRLTGGFGGGYTFIPLAALCFQARRSRSQGAMNA